MTPWSSGPRKAEKSSAELWLWPTAAAVGALVLSTVLSAIRLDPESALSRWAWPGDAAAGTALLQAVATASITTITLAFSVTVVALQLASQQFSPRLLRDFLRDPVTKAVLAVLVASFVYSVTVIREVRADEPVPALALFGASVWGILAVGAVLVFINHITGMLRVDTMMTTVQEEAARAIETFYPDYGDTRPRDPEELDRTGRQAVGLLARQSGFVRAVDVARLVAAAQQHDALVWLDARPGDHVVRGTPFARAWPAGGQTSVPEALADEVHGSVELGHERTVEQDSAFGFRQLTDIAVKALSPGINDPVTAAHCVGHAGDLLVRLTGRRLGGTLHEDEDGTGRVVVDDRDLRYYLDLACGQVRRYGEREPTVLIAVLRMLRDVACSARDDHQRAEIERQVDLVLAQTPSSFAEVEILGVEDAAERVRQVLRGGMWEAYLDRAGETRSL